MRIWSAFVRAGALASAITSAACGAVTSAPPPPSLASFPAMSPPPDHGTRLRGRIRDRYTGAPIPGITVMIGEGPHAVAAITDDGGAYWLDGPGADVALTIYFAASVMQRIEHVGAADVRHVVPDIFVDMHAEPESVALGA